MEDWQGRTREPITEERLEKAKRAPARKPTIIPVTR